MTYNSYDEAPAEIDDFTEESPLDERFKRTPVPLLVMFGAEDQIADAELSIEGYSDVPGVQTEMIEDAGHAPQVEKPDEVAELIEDFSSPPLVDSPVVKGEFTKKDKDKDKKPASDPKKQKKNQKPGSDPSNKKKSN
jgi:hypothetical protein